MKIVVTTSNKYHHLLPVFFYLYNKYWGSPFDLVGYDKPAVKLPNNCTWVSMGVQGDKSEWSTDLIKYFETLPEWFIWLMEDTFIKEPVKEFFKLYHWENVGKICLVKDIKARAHTVDNLGVVYAHPESKYRLSTQPAIWNRDYLLKYLTPNLNPWEFETQDPVNDGYDIIGYDNPPVSHNEGVRRHDIHKLNLEGMTCEDIAHIKTLL